jgi:hypothetical protein
MTYRCPTELPPRQNRASGTPPAPCSHKTRSLTACRSTLLRVKSLFRTHRQKGSLDKTKPRSRTCYESRVARGVTLSGQVLSAAPIARLGALGNGPPSATLAPSLSTYAVRFFHPTPARPRGRIARRIPLHAVVASIEHELITRADAVGRTALESVEPRDALLLARNRYTLAHQSQQSHQAAQNQDRPSIFATTLWIMRIASFPLRGSFYPRSREDIPSTCSPGAQSLPAPFELSGRNMSIHSHGQIKMTARSITLALRPGGPNAPPSSCRPHVWASELCLQSLISGYCYCSSTPGRHHPQGAK